MSGLFLRGSTEVALLTVRGFLVRVTEDLRVLSRERAIPRYRSTAGH